MGEVKGSPPIGGAGGGFLLLLNPLELHLRVTGGELVLHRGAGRETRADALDVRVGELLGQTGGGAVERGTETAEEAQAHALTVLQVPDNLLLHSGDHGADVVGGDGTLLADFLGEELQFDGGDGGGHGIEHSGAGFGVLTLFDTVLDHNERDPRIPSRETSING